MKNPKNGSTTQGTTAKEFFPLMFEMGRLLKHQFNVDGCGPSSYVQLETLRYVGEASAHGDEAPDMRGVADYLRVAAPSATAIVNSLVKEKMLTRVEDSTDRRRVRLAISAKGQKLLIESHERRANAFARVITPLTAKDRAEFARIMRIIVDKSNSK